LHTDYQYDARRESEYREAEKNAFAYVDYVRARWRLIAAASLSAVILAGAASLALPKRYTATASIVIEPPAGNDVRTATAISPVYLESLRTYERFASSDTLFAGAVERFHLTSRESPHSIESLKQQVLKVAKLRDTKILEISATLPDPEMAQQFVSFVAEETVKLSRGESAAGDSEVIGDAERQSTEAHQRLEEAQRAYAERATREPMEALGSQIESDVDLAGKVRQSLIDTRSEIAEYQERADFARELPGLRARAAELEKRAAELEKAIEEKSSLASRRGAEKLKLDVELKMAQTGSETAAARLRDLRATVGTRGERLRVIDPGIVPQRPSSPNVPLNMAAALLLTLVVLAVCLTVSFSYKRRAG
jgi:uncharacterized protein involved in exopolysaccharide biosynthesis